MPRTGSELSTSASQQACGTTECSNSELGAPASKRYVSRGSLRTRSPGISFRNGLRPTLSRVDRSWAENGQRSARSPHPKPPGPNMMSSRRLGIFFAFVQPRLANICPVSPYTGRCWQAWGNFGEQRPVVLPKSLIVGQGLRIAAQAWPDLARIIRHSSNWANSWFPEQLRGDF